MCQTLYRFVADDGSLLYVGRTTDPGRRFAEHRTDKEWWSEIATIELKHFPDAETLRRAERLEIRAEQPKYNVSMNGERRSADQLREQAEEIETLRWELRERTEELSARALADGYEYIQH